MQFLWFIVSDWITWCGSCAEAAFNWQNLINKITKCFSKFSQKRKFNLGRQILINFQAKPFLIAISTYAHISCFEVNRFKIWFVKKLLGTVSYSKWEYCIHLFFGVWCCKCLFPWQCKKLHGCSFSEFRFETGRGRRAQILQTTPKSLHGARNKETINLIILLFCKSLAFLQEE